MITYPEKNMVKFVSKKPVLHQTKKYLLDYLIPKYTANLTCIQTLLDVRYEIIDEMQEIDSIFVLIIVMTYKIVVDVPTKSYF